MSEGSTAVKDCENSPRTPNCRERLLGVLPKSDHRRTASGMQFHHPHPYNIYTDLRAPG